jgi:hypothetical protein
LRNQPQGKISPENEDDQVIEESTQLARFKGSHANSQALVGYSPGQRVSKIFK